MKKQNGLKRNFKTEKLFLKLVEEGYFIVYKNGTVLNTATGNLLGRSNTKYYINISYGPKNKRVGIGLHRLIWLVFKGPIPIGKEINHINGIKSDCRLKNLELVTRSGNTQHAYDIGISPKGKHRFPQAYEKRRKFGIKARNLRRKGWTYVNIANKFNVSELYVHRAVNTR